MHLHRSSKIYHRDHRVHWQRKEHPSTLSIREAAKTHGGRRRCKHLLALRLVSVDEELTYLELSHTEANKVKMTSGIAPADNERWDFSTTMREKAVEVLQQDSHILPAVLVAVSVQEKKKYRDVLRVVRGRTSLGDDVCACKGGGGYGRAAGRR